MVIPIILMQQHPYVNKNQMCKFCASAEYNKYISMIYFTSVNHISHFKWNAKPFRKMQYMPSALKACDYGPRYIWYIKPVMPMLEL